jgi:ubiquinone/menaquinone biosynthesis C-methylase UbiE
MLYHVPDRKKALTEIKRVLKDEGRLIATTVGNTHMREMYQWLKRVNTNQRPDMFSNPFTLENGKIQLAEYFSEIEITHYADNLKVTEVDAILKYIRSSISAADLSVAELVKMESELTATLVQVGEIFITKDSGLFEAIK